MNARTVVSLAATVFLGCAAACAQPVPSSEGTKPSLAPLVHQVTPAVVNIIVESKVEVERNPLLEDPFFRRFFGNMPEGQAPNTVPQRAAGSGVIVDAVNGYILTNYHVVENATDIAVTLADRRRVKATLVGSDAPTDIALLKIDARNLTAVALGDSDQLEVGDYVVAIGNPFGIGQTVTTGIVSALGRAGLSEGAYEDFIQTDASINPGNSGGALIDLDGHLIGINSAIISPAGGNVGIGFAVPSNMAAAVMQQILEYGDVERGLIGISIQDLTPDLATALNIDIDQGALVTEVQPDSPALKAGIEAGDVVTTVNGHAVRGASDLRNRIGLTRAGNKVELGLLRDGKPRQVTALVGAAPAETAHAASSEAATGVLHGAELAEIPQGHPQYGHVEGVLVTGVEAASEADRAGLEADDIITAVNRTPVRSVSELKQALGAVSRPFALNIVRGTARIYVVVQ